MHPSFLISFRLAESFRLISLHFCFPNDPKCSVKEGYQVVLQNLLVKLMMVKSMWLS